MASSLVVPGEHRAGRMTENMKIRLEHESRSEYAKCKELAAIIYHILIVKWNNYAPETHGDTFQGIVFFMFFIIILYAVLQNDSTVPINVTHWGLITPIYVSNIGHQWLRWGVPCSLFGANSSPDHTQGEAQQTH